MHGIKNQTIIVTHSPHETESCAHALGKSLVAGDLLAFRGGLGVGKTTFVRGLCSGLDCPCEATSPTFALIHEYRGGRLPLLHMDAYRLSSAEALLETGFYDYIDMGWIAAVEWSENIEAGVTFTHLIEIMRIDDDTRRIIITKKEDSDEAVSD